MLVHPRACGGTRQPEDRQAGRKGASPRVRGNHDAAVSVPDHRRCIPARAGEPLIQLQVWFRIQVHPRACGGTSRPQVVACPPYGASPRVRGNRRSRSGL